MGTDPVLLSVTDPDPSLGAVPRISVHEEIRERISRYVTDSGLQAGDRLPGEAALAM